MTQSLRSVHRAMFFVDLTMVKLTMVQSSHFNQKRGRSWLLVFSASIRDSKVMQRSSLQKWGQSRNARTRLWLGKPTLIRHNLYFNNLFCSLLQSPKPRIVHLFGFLFSEFLYLILVTFWPQFVYRWSSSTNWTLSSLLSNPCSPVCCEINFVYRPQFVFRICVVPTISVGKVLAYSAFCKIDEQGIEKQEPRVCSRTSNTKCE